MRFGGGMRQGADDHGQGADGVLPRGPMTMARGWAVISVAPRRIDRRGRYHASMVRSSQSLVRRLSGSERAADGPQGGSCHRFSGGR